MTNRLFQKYIDKARRAKVDMRGDRASIDWFRKIVTKGGQISNIEKVTEGLEVSRLVPGELVTYGYDPKHAESLDFYDRHPLIVFLERTADGWYGLNLHYLPPIARAKIFEELDYNKKNLPSIVRDLQRNEQTKVCLKRYLVSHTTSKPKTIPKEMWEIAIALPYDKFMKESNKTVWSLSKRRRNAKNR